MRKSLMVLFAVFALSGQACSERQADANREQTRQTAELLSESNRQVGMPGINNFTEKRLVRQLYELRDQQDRGRKPETVNGLPIRKVGCRGCDKERREARLEDLPRPGCKSCSGRGWVVAVIVPRKEKPGPKRKRSAKGLLLAAAAVAHHLAGAAP